MLNAGQASFGEFSRLPQDIQRDVFEKAAYQAAVHQPVPSIDITISICRSPADVRPMGFADLVVRNRPPRVSRILVAQLEHSDMMDQVGLARLCRESRRAVLHEETFLLHFSFDPPAFFDSISTPRTEPAQTVVSKRLHGLRDSTRHVILGNPIDLVPAGINTGAVSTPAVFDTLVPILGTKVQHLYFMLGRWLAVYGQPDRVGYRLSTIERIIYPNKRDGIIADANSIGLAIVDIFSGLRSKCYSDAPDVGTFEASDARVFCVRLAETSIATEKKKLFEYVEVIRQYPDGRTKVNLDLKSQLEAPLADTAHLLVDRMRVMCGLAIDRLPDLKYISVLASMCM